jgi:hypothetical protein
MKNVETSVSGDTLTIKVNLKAIQGPSASGKSLVIASSEGNQSVPGFPDIKMGLNVYTGVPKAPAPAKKA